MCYVPTCTSIERLGITTPSFKPGSTTPRFQTGIHDPQISNQIVAAGRSHRRDLDHSPWWLYNLPTRDDEYLCQHDTHRLPPGLLTGTVNVSGNAVGCRRSTQST